MGSMVKHIHLVPLTVLQQTCTRVVSVEVRTVHHRLYSLERHTRLVLACATHV